MKKSFVFLVLCVVFVPVSVMAQHNVIRAIQPDGSVVEAEMPEQKQPHSTPQPQPQPQPQPVSPPVSPADLASSPPAAIKKPVEKSIPAKAAKAPKPEKSKEIPKPQVHTQKESVPIPAPEAPGQSMLPPRAKPEAAPGEYISKAQAFRIALDYAPPARSYDVLPRTHQDGRFIYIVRFLTEAGPRDILVDAQDGKIIN